MNGVRERFLYSDEMENLPITEAEKFLDLPKDILYNCFRFFDITFVEIDSRNEILARKPLLEKMDECWWPELISGTEEEMFSDRRFKQPYREINSEEVERFWARKLIPIGAEIIEEWWYRKIRFFEEGIPFPYNSVHAKEQLGKLHNNLDSWDILVEFTAFPIVNQIDKKEKIYYEFDDIHVGEIWSLEKIMNYAQEVCDLISTEEIRQSALIEKKFRNKCRIVLNPEWEEIESYWQLTNSHLENLLRESGKPLSGRKKKIELVEQVSEMHFSHNNDLDMICGNPTNWECGLCGEPFCDLHLGLDEQEIGLDYHDHICIRCKMKSKRNRLGLS